MYIALDGADGCGKSSQARHLRDRLEALGADAVLVREPGSTALAERLREMLLDQDVALAPISEALLFFAARAELVRQVVRPHLEAGRTVVSDRSFASTLVYQHLALSPGAPELPDMDLLLSLTRTAHAWSMPNLLFVLDVTPQTARLRRSRRDHVSDRFEARDLDFQARVCEAFRTLATRDDVAGLFEGDDDLHKGVVRIDAEADYALVSAQIVEQVSALQQGAG